MTIQQSSSRCPKCGNSIPVDAPKGLCPRCVLSVAAAVRDTQSAPDAMSEVPSMEKVSAAFPALEIVELIGRGGMGFVYKARQPQLDRWVALKLLPEKLAQDPRFAERFHREGRVLARLHHPNIVTVFDFGRSGGFYFLTMEYLDGANLRQAMEAGRFSPAEALAIIPKICDALQYAHDQGILHRDIKPENILLDARGQVKIADFGIAKLLDEDPTSITLTGTGSAIGTPHYMAPEQLEKPFSVDHRADIYSLGVVFYEMLTGELPIGRFSPPSAKTPVSSQVDELVFRTLEKDRDKRFQSAGEVKDGVEQIADNGAATLPQTAESGSSRNHVSPLSFRAAIGAALVGTSLVVPLSRLIGVLDGREGATVRELWMAMTMAALPGVGGTLVGWLGLNEIREAPGRIRGRRLALFATLAWPIIAVTGLALSPLLGLKISATTAAGPLWGIRILTLLLPLSLLAGLLWAVPMVVRWSLGKEEHRGLGGVKWVVSVILVLLFVSLVFWVPRPAPPQVASLLPSHTSPARIGVKLRAPKGEAVMLELIRHGTSGVSHHADEAVEPLFSGVILTPEDSRGGGELALVQLGSGDWMVELASDDAGKVGARLPSLGDLVPASTPAGAQRLDLRSGQSLDLPLTLPLDASSKSGVSLAMLSLRVRSVARAPSSSVTVSNTVVSAGSTNWVTVLHNLHVP